MKVTFANSKKTPDVIGQVSSTADIAVENKKFVFHKCVVNGNEENVVHTAALKAGDKFTHEDATMTGAKGPFPALWTVEARAALEGPLATSGPFKEGEEVKATVKILKCEPKMKGNVQSTYSPNSTTILYHYTVTFEYDGKAIIATSQIKEQDKLPFNNGETVEVMVSVKSGYVNIKKIPGAFGGRGFGGGSGSKHDAWARVYSTHFIDARKDNDYAASKAMAIAAANEVIKKMEV